MPRYFVSGLCMQGNKGGPALVLSIMKVIRDYIPDAEFIFSVPENDAEWVHEKKWAEKYNVEIVKNIGLRNLLPPYNLMPGRLGQLISWGRALRKCDALIQMSAVCFVGPPSGTGTFISMVGSTRVQDFFLSKFLCRPMHAWTQSYGPFSTLPVKYFARLDLKRQKIIFCRGNKCCEEVKKILPEVKAMSFPDVAVTLPFDKEWGKVYLNRKLSDSKPVVSLSPSAVMYSRFKSVGKDNQHIIQVLEILNEIKKTGFSVILVPHTLRPSSPNPNVCDLAVSKVVASLADDPDLKIVEEDFSPSELKSIISSTEIHIGARYHSVVAALSSCVPTISMSWHSKYSDLMKFYGMEEYVLEENCEGKIALELIDQIITKRNELSNMLISYQGEVEDQVSHNARLFCALLEGKDYEVPSMRFV